MKNKTPTVDAQQVKRRLLWMAKKLGNRKRLTGPQIFDLILKANQTVP